MVYIPHELIRDIQIRTRAEAGLPDYKPALPSSPSLSAEVTALDPSPTELRCENCRGRLLRGGSESLICMHCGRVPQNGVVREPLCFSSTVGYTWLLRSLGLDGSEIVEPHKGKNERDRRQRRPPMTLSESLNFKIPWPAGTRNQETSVSYKHLDTNQISLSSFTFTGVALDNFFIKSQVEVILSDLSIEQKSTQTHIEASGYKGVFFHPSDSHSQSFQVVRSSSKDETDEAFSQWEADFQSAGNRSPLDSENRFQESQTFNPFMDIEPLRSKTENFFPSMSMEQKVMHDHVATSGNEATAARGEYDLFENFQSSETKGLDMTGHEQKTEKLKKIDRDLFEGCDNFTSSTSETKSDDIMAIKTMNKEHMKMDGDDDDDLLRGWGSFTSSSLRVSSETKNADLFEGWGGDLNKSKNFEPKPMDEDSFEGQSGFKGSTNLQVSSEIKLDPSDDKVSMSDKKSSEVNLFDWGNMSQCSGFDGYSQGSFFSHLN